MIRLSWLVFIGALCVITVIVGDLALSQPSIGAVTPAQRSPNLGQWVLVPPGTSEDLRDVDMVTSNNGWAVGENGVVLRYDGVQWQQVNISTTDTLVDVFMLDANNGYIVGWAPEGADIFHFDGNVWSLDYHSVDSMQRIGGSSAHNIWAVGLNATLHWDGNQWSIVPIPVQRQLFAVAVLSDTDAWAVGQYEPVSQHGLILHNTGSGWVQVPSTAPQTIFDTFFLSENDGWATSTAVTTSYILRYNGVQWSTVFTNHYQIDRLYMNTPTEGWAMSSISRIIAHYDGQDFTPVNNPATSYITGINMLSQYEGWIVGGQGTMLHYLDTPPPSPTSTPTRTPTATPCPMTFTDVFATDYFYVPVRYLYCRGVVSGYADNTFRPYNNTTRGQLAKIVVLAEGWPLYTPPTPTFVDVPPSHTFYLYIETAYRQGIISGYTCGPNCLEFRPGNFVTRAQLCKITVLAQGWTLYSPPTPTFQDVSSSNPFYAYIETAYLHAIISGYVCGSSCLEFRPSNSATRGQICKIVYLAVTTP